MGRLVLEDVGDLGLFEVLALRLWVFEVVVGGEVAVAVVDVGLALALDGVGTRIFVVGVAVLGLALRRCPYFDFGLRLLLVVREVRSDSVLLQMGVVGEIQVPGRRSGHFFLSLTLTVVVAILEIEAVGLAVPALLLLHGGGHGDIGSVLFVLDGDGEGVGLDFIVDLIWHDVHLIEHGLEIALRLMVAVLAARKLPRDVVLEVLFHEYLGHLARIVFLDGLCQIESGMRVLLAPVLLDPLGLCD